MILVRKKDGNLQQFNLEKIGAAATKALVEVGETDAKEIAYRIAVQISGDLKDRAEVDYNEIHNMVEIYLMDYNKQAAKAYILHRQKHKDLRAGNNLLMEAIRSTTKEISKDNANIHNCPSSKMYEIGSAANKHYVLNHTLPKHLAEAHSRGDIHIHDLNYYTLTYNCINYGLGKLLERGFRMPHGWIRPPKTIMAASALTAVTLQSIQNDQYGGVGIDALDLALGKYAESATYREVYQAMEALIFNLNSLHSRAGNQIPFSSISIGLGTNEGSRKVTKAILEVYLAGLGRGEQPMFPNIIFKVKKGINFEPGTPNHDLLLQALQVTSHRMNPTYAFMDSSFNTPYGDQAMYMGCRTRVIANVNGPSTTDGRGNIGFVTINLPRLAIDSDSVDDFFQRYDSIIDLCEEQLMHRFELLSNLRVEDVPFVFGEGIYMGADKLNPGDKIGEALKNGTLTIGFIGLAETLKALFGKHHGQSEEAQKLGLRIVEYLRAKCDTLTVKHKLNYSVIATPAEGLADRFLKIDRKKYGILEGITDKEFYSNSFHVPVDFDIDIERKVALEGVYHKYCNGGHISYVELGEAPIENTDGLYRILQCMSDSDMGYAGLNFPIDYCQECSFQGIIPNECKVCGSNSVVRVRRVTGYFSKEGIIGPGKHWEIKLRTAHSGKKIEN